MRTVLGKITTKDRCKTCGALPVGPGGTVTLLRAEVDGIGTVAGVKGAGRCRMVNLCPWCGAHAREERAMEVERYTTRHLRAGGSVWFGAFTIAAVPGEEIEDTTKVVQECWSTMWSGRWSQDFRARFGMLAAPLRAYEWTIRLDGSGHPHIHPLAFLDRDLDQGEQIEFYAGLLFRWRAVVRGAGRDVHLVHGVQLTPVTLDEEGRTVGLGEYLSKAGSWGIGHEMARVDVKRARTGGSLSPWELLAYFAATGDVAARSAWQAYERAASGKAAIYWPPRLRAKLDAFAGEPEPTLPLEDVEPAQADETTDDDTDEVITKLAGARPVVTFDYQAWRWIHGLGLTAVVLRLVELASSDDEVPELILTLFDRLRAPGVALAGVSSPEPDPGS